MLEAVKAASFIVAHNAKFELQWLARCGLDLHNLVVYDTVLGEWGIAGNLPVRKDLQSTAMRYGVAGKENCVSVLIKNGVDIRNIPLDWLSKYCVQDVSTTVDMFLKQRQVLKERDQLHIQWARCLLTPVLADMESTGVTLDPKRVAEEYERVKAEHEDSESKLAILAAKYDYAEINWRSRPQVAEFLYDKLGFEELRGRDRQPCRTSTGQRRTDKAAIVSLVATTADQKYFSKEYTKLAMLSARLTKCLTFFNVVCNEYGNTFRGIFNQGVTSTHRLSSSGRKVASEDGEEYGAQLQNLPREYKRLFKARRDGWRMAEIDSSQLEFRVAVDLGKDATGYQEIVEGADIHSITAAKLTEAGEPTSRQEAKSRTFRPLYGGNTGTKAEEAYCKFFQNKYSGIS